jgi:hypothetical protein
MCIAVHLDDQHPWAPAGEVRDVAADHNLSAEFHAGEALGAECIPELLLEGRLVRAELFGTGE